jgi:putative transposase
LKRERNYAGQNLWTRGDFVDSVGRNTEVIRWYIQEQEAEDKRMDKMEFPHRYNLVNEPLKEDIK